MCHLFYFFNPYIKEIPDIAILKSLFFSGWEGAFDFFSEVAGIEGHMAFIAAPANVAAVNLLAGYHTAVDSRWSLVFTLPLPKPLPRTSMMWFSVLVLVKGRVSMRPFVV